jgi:hypothetical protein
MNRQARVPAGVPTGGQFAPTSRPEASDVELTEESENGVAPPAAIPSVVALPTQDAPPLADFKVVGITEQTQIANAGTPFAREVAGGSCWHCGTSIRICVMARNQKTGEVVTVGSTCAERIGLDLFLTSR